MPKILKILESTGVSTISGVSNTNPIFVGYINHLTSGFFDGVAFLRTGISGDNMTNILYRNVEEINGLFCYFPIDEGTGNYVYDITNSGFTGIILTGTWK